MSCARRSFFAMLAVLSLGARAEMVVDAGAGLEFSQGDYDTSKTSTQWVLPISAGVRFGPWSLDAFIPFISADGTVNRETGAVAVNPDGGQTAGQGTATLRTESETQSGLGDVVIGGALNLVPEERGLGVAVGLRAKFVTADRDDDLLTTGHRDYLAHVDIHGTVGRTWLAGSVAYTRKGDIDLRDDGGAVTRLDPDNPLSLSLSATFPARALTQFGAAYFWREKLFDGADAANEATLFATHRFGGPWRLRAYTLLGFSDASPDWGLGASVSRAW